MTTWIDRRPPIRIDQNMYDVLDIEEVTTYSKTDLLAIREEMKDKGLLQKVPDAVKKVNKQILDAQQAPPKRKHHYRHQPHQGLKRKFSFPSGGSNAANWRAKT